MELPVDLVLWARRSVVADRGAHGLAPHHAAQAGLPHQSLDRAARRHNALALQLLPDLVGTVDLKVGPMHPLDVGQQRLITPGALRTPARMRTRAA